MVERSHLVARVRIQRRNQIVGCELGRSNYTGMQTVWMHSRIGALCSIHGASGSAVAAIGMRDGVANVDLMRVQGRVFVLKIGARMGATCLPENLSAYTGVDLYGHVIETALGADVPFAPDPTGVATTSILLQAPASGVLGGVDLPEELLQGEQVYEWCVDNALGERVRPFTTGPDRIGHVVTVARTADTAIQEATRLASKFRFTVESVSDESSDWVRQPVQGPAAVLRGGQWLRPERLRAA